MSIQVSQSQESKRPLIDQYGRCITHFRLSVTSKCNLSCPYCHEEGHITNKPDMPIELISKITEVAAQHSVFNFKITGGEPLLRSDIIDIVRLIAETPGTKEISMTTNGYHLAKLADSLKEAGLNRVNIGCDSFSGSQLPKNIDTISSWS